MRGSECTSSGTQHRGSDLFVMDDGSKAVVVHQISLNTHTNSGWPWIDRVPSLVLSLSPPPFLIN